MGAVCQGKSRPGRLAWPPTCFAEPSVGILARRPFFLRNLRAQGSSSESAKSYAGEGVESHPSKNEGWGSRGSPRIQIEPNDLHEKAPLLRAGLGQPRRVKFHD